jgi:hypothetical protein
MIPSVRFCETMSKGRLSAIAARWAPIDLRDQRVSGRERYPRMNRSVAFPVAESVLMRVASFCGQTFIQLTPENAVQCNNPWKTHRTKPAPACIVDVPRFITSSKEFEYSQLTVSRFLIRPPLCPEPNGQAGHTTRIQRGPPGHYQIAGEGMRRMVGQQTSLHERVNESAYPV